jgi:hypothetical protein
MKAKMCRTATQIRALREQFLNYQCQAHNCADTLADADAQWKSTLPISRPSDAQLIVFLIFLDYRWLHCTNEWFQFLSICKAVCAVITIVIYPKKAISAAEHTSGAVKHCFASA